MSNVQMTRPFQAGHALKEQGKHHWKGVTELNFKGQD